MKYTLEILGDGYVLVNKHYKTSLNSFIQTIKDLDRVVKHNKIFKGFKGE